MSAPKSRRHHQKQAKSTDRQSSSGIRHCFLKAERSTSSIPCAVNRELAARRSPYGRANSNDRSSAARACPLHSQTVSHSETGRVSRLPAGLRMISRLLNCDVQCRRRSVRHRAVSALRPRNHPRPGNGAPAFDRECRSAVLITAFGGRKEGRIRMTVGNYSLRRTPPLGAAAPPLGAAAPPLGAAAPEVAQRSPIEVSSEQAWRDKL